MITYRRYLRFLPNGLVYSMLSSDNTASSQEVVSLLRPDGPHIKGLRIGRWRVEEQPTENGQGTEPIVMLTGLMDAGVLGHGNTTTADAKYTFTMRLGLRTKPLGRYIYFQLKLSVFTNELILTKYFVYHSFLDSSSRWNKLDILRYESVRIGSGEAIPLPLKSEKPFWFSKVLSYGSGLEI